MIFMYPAQENSVVPQARRDALSWAEASGIGADVLDDVGLIVTELISNSVKHGAVPIKMVLHADEDTNILIVVVSDAGTVEGPLKASCPVPEASHGRGLLLVDALCQEWGNHLSQEPGYGTTVWAMIPAVSEPTAPEPVE